MTRRRGFQFFAALFVVAALLLVGVGISLIESPATMKLKKADQRRVADLSGIEWAIQKYVEREGHLPASLDMLIHTTSQVLSLQDPETKAEYPYKTLSDDRYEICAVFHLSNIGSNSSRPVYNRKQWHHASGNVCFEIEVGMDNE